VSAPPGARWVGKGGGLDFEGHYIDDHG
jgi:hypothetical protein